MVSRSNANDGCGAFASTSGRKPTKPEPSEAGFTYALPSALRRKYSAYSSWAG